MALKTITGKVQKAGAYPLPEPKTVNFGKGPKEVTHRLSLQLDSGDWFGFGETDKDSFIVKDDEGNWKVLGAGSEVLIKYQQNGDYKNAKKSNLTVISLVEGEKFQKGGQSSKPSSGGTQAPKSDNFVNPAALGNAGNYLMHSLEFKHEDMMDDDKILEGLVKYHKSREQLARFWEKAEALAKEEKPPFKTEEKVDEYDDSDI